MNQKLNGKVIFITGGAGIVGSYITEELLLLNPKKILILDNLSRGKAENVQGFINHPKVEFHQGDIRDNALIDRLMAQSNYCFHLAALRNDTCSLNPVDCFDVMVKGTFDLVESARKHQISKFIYPSSVAIYGQAQNFPTPETDNPYNNPTIYGAAKLFGEQLLRSYHHSYGLNYVSLRYFNVYGPRMDTQGSTEVMIKWLNCIKNGTPPLIYGDGSTSMDYIFVSDIAKATVAALLSDITDQNINLGTGREISLKDLLDLLLKINNSKLKPKFMAENKINPVERRLADIEKAKNLLHFSPAVQLEEGMKLLSDWFFRK